MIEVTDAGFFYEPERWIFRHHSFVLEQGEVWAILGPNGRGKTTFLKCLLGLRRPKEGGIRLGGSAGYVPQVYQLAFPYPVLDLVLMGRARHLGIFASPGRRDLDIAHQALERLGMSGFAERTLPSLSGGERQLVLIARALASACELLVLDEPASALDLKNQRLVLTLLRRLAGEGLTVVLTSHNPQHAYFVADKVALMLGPESYLFGPTESTMSEARLRRLYNVELRRVSFEHGGQERQTVVPIYD